MFWQYKEPGHRQPWYWHRSPYISRLQFLISNLSGHYWCHISDIKLEFKMNFELTTDTRILSPWWHHQMETFPHYWPFVQGNHRSPVNSLHKGQWREVLMFSMICAWINGWVNNDETGDLRRHLAHYDVTVMPWVSFGNIYFKIFGRLLCHMAHNTLLNRWKAIT